LETPMTDRPSREPRTTATRTCVGCGEHVDPTELVRLVVADDEVVFDLAGGAFGRGAHVHARPGCLAGTPRGLARSFKREIKLGAAELGQRLVDACDRRMTGLLLAARRTGALAVGTDESLGAIRRGAPLAIVAVDAGSVAKTREVEHAVAEGRAIAWMTKESLGAVLGEKTVAICAVRHDKIANQLKTLRAAADAGAATTREGARCSSPVPEAR
jgi:predicted RNA-binding protein YlxR (DUF448 family)/ribosomal protein L7Ae-like RNA K-turn-binding protein